MKTIIITLATVATATIFSSCGSAPDPAPQNEVIYSGAKGGLDTYSAKGGVDTYSSKSSVPVAPPAAPSNGWWKPNLP